MLYLHRAEHTGTLADALADILAVPLADPMCPEIVSVPAAGVERWLQQHLAARLGCRASAGDGIAANIDFSPPAALADTITATVADHGRRTRLNRRQPDDDPWRASPLVWPVLAVLDEHVTDPGLAMIARHIGGGDPASPRIGRRFATARHIADLFHRYGRSRPTMLADWAAGRDLDGAGAAVPEDMAWQPDFWRALRAEIGRPHPAESLPDICARLRDDPAATDLPERLSVFGPTRVTEDFRQLLVAVAHHRDVHLFLPHPSPALWDQLAAPADAFSSDALHAPRRADAPEPVVSHPLLASLSRDVQELQARMLPYTDSDIHHEPASGADRSTLLAALQAELRADMPTPHAVPADSSVEVHSCHGPERQVDVLRDRLLHLFAEDPTLAPRDVLIMCPDVETFAPLIRGAFGQDGLAHPAFALRVRLADRGVRHANPILDVVAAVVELAAARVTATEVVDLLAHKPVRARFAFTDDDTDRIREWLVKSNIRWGIGNEQRARYGLGGFGQGTFDFGLDRIALGAVAEEQDGEWLGTALPLAGVEGTDIDLAGRFAEFVARLSRSLTALTTTATRNRWSDALVDVAEALTATEPGEDWQRASAIRMITEAFDADEAGGESAAPVLRLADVRDLMAALVAGRPTRSNFRTGELTVCTMVPMRSVPHRVIVLLGIDGDVFPRVQRIDGDDILGVDPLVGERNPRDEDRQCFLDAICAASESLLVFYSGADPVSGRRIPPAVVVSELIDAVQALIAPADSPAPAVDPVRRHTLHGFDRRNFVDGGIGGLAGPFSHDESLLEGARALGGRGTVAGPISQVDLPAWSSDDIDLDTLIEFHTDPIAGFLRQRLEARIPTSDNTRDDQLDVALDPLEAWGIGDRFLRRMLAGASIEQCQAAERRRGSLPPYAFGTRTLATISTVAENLYRAVAELRTGNPVTLDVDVTLPDGRRVYGTVSNVFGSQFVTATYSRLRAKQQLAEWMRVVTIAAAADQGNAAAADVATGVIVGRGYGLGAGRITFARPVDATAILDGLVRIRDLGLRRPLPLPRDAAAAFALAERRGDNGLDAARKSFDGDYGEHTDAALRFVFGGDVLSVVDFAELLVRKVDNDFAADLVPEASGEPLFVGLARAIWTPLLAAAEGIR